MDFAVPSLQKATITAQTLRSVKLCTQKQLPKLSTEAGNGLSVSHTCLSFTFAITWMTQLHIIVFTEITPQLQNLSNITLLI